jgi:hypothetical protein
MKTKTFTLRFVATALMILFFTLLAQNTSSQNTLLVEYALNSTTQTASTGGIAANHPGGVFSTTALNLAFTGNVAQTTNWNSGTPGGYKLWQTSSFSTFGYHSIRVSATLYSTASTGPRDFVVEYKIGASGTWTSVQNLNISNSPVNYDVFLPDECRNQASLFVRWRARSYISLNGGTVAAAARNFIRSVSIAGSVPEVPGFQAKTITIISVTPTTITVGCTPGGGDNRIIVIKRVDNNFTNPVDDAIYTANPVYSGSGEQVIYNGPGSSVVVTVPDSRFEYYFRVYDYRLNGGMTR